MEMVTRCCQGQEGHHTSDCPLCMCVWVYQYMANVDFKPTLRTNKPIYTTFTQLLETNTKLQATVQITQMLHKQGDYSCLLMSSYIHGSSM